jgi:ABC-type polysaccharide/polyol phosphate transport system ATPase subunit
MSSEIAIQVQNLQKTYHIYPTPMSRLKQIIAGKSRQYYDEFSALDSINFTLHKGEVLGVVGRNGAGKSTLLQLICGTLTPSSGELIVNGKIAALLELGAGFNPEFSGRENVYLSAAVMGIKGAVIDSILEDIIDFSGIREFIDQPVKTYSSGMYVRLAFSVATSVKPDILIIDEALSVGDGDFSRRSFDRIIEMRDAGATILFCSHSLYQLETLCSRSIWLDNGKLMADGPSEKVVTEYQSFLDRLSLNYTNPTKTTAPKAESEKATTTRITSTRVSIDGHEGKTLTVKSKESTLLVEIEYISQFIDKPPGVAVTIEAASGLLIASSGTWNENIYPSVDENGKGFVCIKYPHIPLLKGRYTVGIVLFCERGLMIYDEASPIATLEVIQKDAERGMVALPHHWSDTLDSTVENNTL